MRARAPIDRGAGALGLASGAGAGGFRTPRWVVLALCVATLAASGCGYRFAVGEAGLPPGIGAVYVPVFDNRSSEGEAGAIFAEAMADALAREGKAAGPQAPARLEGTVISLTSTPVATQRDGTGVGMYQLRARLQLRLLEGETVRCTREIEGGEDYLPSVHLLGLDAARGQAMRRLATRLMEQAARNLCST